MEQQEIGTIDGKPITQEMLDSFTATFERTWAPSEVRVIPTERGKVLRALHDLNIPLYEIEALERRAKQKQQTLAFFIHSVLQNELFAVNEQGNALDDFVTNNPTKVDPSKARHAIRMVALDDFAAEYILLRSIATHKTPTEVISDLIKEKLT